LKKQKSVAVIIPAYNEETFIAGCIDSLLAQNYPQDKVEIIVADNGSTDSTIKIAESHGIKTCIIPDVKVGAVRNCGVNNTSGDIVAFIDSDCLAPSHWLKSAVEELESNPNLGAVGGPYFADDKASWMEKVWAGKKSKKKREVPNLTGGSFIMSRELFLRLGGFDVSLSAGEDDEFSHRISESGYSLMHTPNCAVIHLGWPKSLNQVFRRQIWQGTNQIEAADNPFNLGLLLVHVFAICLFLSMGTFFTNRFSELQAIWILPLALIPMIGALKRGCTESSLPNPIAFSQLLLIFIFYYLGRTIGLTLNYYSRITKRSFKTFK